MPTPLGLQVPAWQVLAQAPSVTWDEVPSANRLPSTFPVSTPPSNKPGWRGGGQWQDWFCGLRRPSVCSLGMCGSEILRSPGTWGIQDLLFPAAGLVLSLTQSSLGRWQDQVCLRPPAVLCCAWTSGHLFRRGVRVEQDPQNQGMCGSAHEVHALCHQVSGGCSEAKAATAGQGSCAGGSACRAGPAGGGAAAASQHPRCP